MKVTNINGTSQSTTTCACGSWLKHWEKFSGQEAKKCSAFLCFHTDLQGAHVQKADSSDRKWYIVPLCGKHNKATEDVDLRVGTVLVPANKSETCEK